MIRQYKSKFYLNASHYIVTNGNPGVVHSHCFEIIVCTTPVDSSQEIMFNLFEDEVEKVLFPYQKRIVNEVEPFNTINPTLENMCEHFAEIFIKEAIQNGIVVVSVQISETPSRAYIINAMDKDLSAEQSFSKKEDVLVSDAEKMLNEYNQNPSPRSIAVTEKIIAEAKREGRNYWDFDI